MKRRKMKKKKKMLSLKPINRKVFLQALFEDQLVIGEYLFEYVYITFSEKILLLTEEDDEVFGYYLMKFTHGAKQSMQEFVMTETPLIRLTHSQFLSFFPQLSQFRLKKEARKHHMPIIPHECRLYAGRFKALFKEYGDQTVMFQFDGYTRHRIVTTGIVFGSWGS